MPIMRNENRIAPGMERDYVVRAFQECVNQPNTMFSTDHWLLPKLDCLRTLLYDPITALLQTDEEWLCNWRKSLTRKQRAQMERKHLPVAQKECLPIAQPCPGCGLPAEKLKWLRYRSRRSTWVNLCGRAGWKTRCRICRQEIDFFMTIMN